MRKYSKQFNIIWDGHLNCARLVCAHCRVPLSPTEPRVDIGKDGDKRTIYICRDCQRDVTDETVLPKDDQEDDPWWLDRVFMSAPATPPPTVRASTNVVNMQQHRSSRARMA